jgi:hypothetical protein
MPGKNITYEALTYSWVLILSIWGGAASYLGKVRHGKLRFSIVALMDDLLISGFVGVITFFLCQSAALEQWLSAAIIGVSSHMGSRAIMMLEKALELKFEKAMEKDK